MHINLLKALLPPKARKSDGEPSGEDKRLAAISLRCTGLLDIIRRALNVILQSGIIPECQLEQILCTIGKVEGSNELTDTRPLTLVSITLNMAVGLQMNKVMHRLDELGAIDNWQAGFRSRVGTEEPLLETRLVAEHCWQYNVDLWAGDEDKKQAFDCPPECASELSMDRLAVPYRFIKLIKFIGNKALISVRTAWGMTLPFSKNQGFPQGGRHSPHLWTIFDDPLCTAMNAETETEEGDPAVVSVPFAKPVRVSGKSFADDKRFLASTHAGLQRRFDMSALWNKLNDVETNVSKSAAQALVQAPGGKYRTKDQLPDITMMNWRTGEREVVTMHDPDEPLKSLGMQTTLALSDGYAVDEAKKKADRVGVCVAKGSSPDALWTRLISQVAQRSALYCIHTASVGTDDLTAIHARCHRAFKAKAGLCVTTPNEIVSALVTLDWASQHYIEQTVMIMKYLQRPGSTLEALLCAAVQHHALWQGGDCTLGALAPTNRGWDGTLLGRLHHWMAQKHLELKGPIRTPDSRAGDALLRTHARSDEERDALAAGSWIVEAWRIADCLCWDGSLVAALQLNGTWQREINKVTPGLGIVWRAAASAIVEAWLEHSELGLRARGAIRTGAYVCLPADQADALLGDTTLVIGVVVADLRDAGGWDDSVRVRRLEPLPLIPGEPSLLLPRIGHKLPLNMPYARDALATELHNVRSSTLTRGTLYADCPGSMEMWAQASSLLEVKVAEVKLKGKMHLGGAENKSTTLLIQLDEELSPVEARALWALGRVETTPSTTTFDFPDRDRVIGRAAADAHGWRTDDQQWTGLLTLEAARRVDGLRTTLMLLSDGSVKGDGFSASSTYGWVSYAAMLSGAEGPTYIDAVSGHVLAGGGKVAGPPEWTSSTRAEATGLLAALMGAMTAGWEGDIDLRLDNDSAVGRGGGLVLDEGSDFFSDSATETCTDFTLRDGMTIENSDIWTEFTAWRDAHRETGARVTVSWHPGHPERRKCSLKSDWDRADHAIFLADVVAEAMHTLPTPTRTPTQWSHKSPWTLHWRGTEQHGCIAQRLHDAVRTELLASYMQGTGLGAGTDTDWVIPELTARTIGQKEGSLRHRVHRAKVVASILGTKYTQHRRNGLAADDDPMCRLCGLQLETDNHVLWECLHPAVASKRRELAKAVRKEWRRAGLGQIELGVANLLWTLKPDDSVACTSLRDAHRLLGEALAPQAALLTASLIGHTLDTTGVAAERNGLFGAGWIRLLHELGLDRPSALDALVSVAATLHGPHGTFAIWSAFTSILDTPETHVADMTAPRSSEYSEWAVSIRDRLRVLKIEDDQPYRTLTAMDALGMTNDDKFQFADLVQGWLDSLKLPGADAHDWAETLVDAIAQARVEVIDARQRLGQRQIKARDRARADAKMTALERRARRTPNPPAPKGSKRRASATEALSHRPAPGHTTAAGTAQRTKTGRPVGRPPRAVAASTKAPTAPKADKRKATDSISPAAPDEASDAAAPRGPRTRAKRRCNKTKVDKRKQHDGSTDTETTTTGSVTKRTCSTHKADKRKGTTDQDTATDTDTAPSNKRPCSKHKADKRKGTDTDTDTDTDTAPPTKRSCNKHKADKRKGTDTESDTDTEANTCATDTNKRARHEHRADKRRGTGSHQETQGRSKRTSKDNRTNKEKRARDDDSQQGICHPTARQLRATTREQLSKGTTNLEPD